MKCPKCGSQEMSVFKTRHARKEVNGVLRTRHCVGCKAKFLTVEVITEEIRDNRSLSRLDQDIVEPQTDEIHEAASKATNGSAPVAAQ